MAYNMVWRQQAFNILLGVLKRRLHFGSVKIYAHQTRLHLSFTDSPGVCFGVHIWVEIMRKLFMFMNSGHCPRNAEMRTKM